MERSTHTAAAAELLRSYDTALPEVYGYLLRRTGRADVAEELTAETFLAAAAEVRRPQPAVVDVPWLVGVARHKLADHWRRQARVRRALPVLAADAADAVDDPRDAAVDMLRARETLATLAPQHRAALTLRYLDDRRSRTWPPSSTAPCTRPRPCWCGPGPRSVPATPGPRGRRTAVRDPFEQLRDPAGPVDPDPGFAAGLRDRLAEVLALPRGVEPVSETPTSPAPAEEARTVPRPGAMPYLCLADTRAALDWYEEVFGATVVGSPVVMDDGRVGHAELAIGDGVLYLADAFPEIGVTAPRPGEAPVSLMLAVADVDEMWSRALAAGATAVREPYDSFGLRNAWLVDPFGHRWGLHSPPRAAS